MNPWLSREFIQALGWTLVHFLWQGLAIAALLAATLRLLRRAPAQYRYLAGCAALALMALAPLVTFRLVLPRHEIVSAPATISAESPWVESPLPVAATRPVLVVTALPEPHKVKFSERMEMVFPWLVLGWLVGVCALSCRLFAGWLQVRRLRRMATSHLPWSEKMSALARRLGVHRPIRLLQSALVGVPTVIGWLRPVILLPASCVMGLPPEQLEAILAHELAHIRRHDYLVNLLQSAVETLLFYHPAVWWVSRQIRAEREHCCDDLAVEVCGDPVGYARALATLEELRPASAQLALAAGGAPLLQRIRRLVAAPERSAGRGPWPVAGIAAILVLVILAAGMREHRAAAQQHDALSTQKTNNPVAANESAVSTNIARDPWGNPYVVTADKDATKGTVSTTNSTRPLEVNIQVKFVELPFDAGIRRWNWGPRETNLNSLAAQATEANTNSFAVFLGLLTDSQFHATVEALQHRDGIDVLTAPGVTTESGRQAQVQAVDLQQIVTSAGLGFGKTNQTGYLTNSRTGAVTPATITLPFGLTVDVTPFVSADAESIQMTLIPSVTEFIGYDHPNPSAPQDFAPAGGVTAPAVPASPPVGNLNVSQASVGSGGTTVTAVLPLPHFRLRQIVTNVSAWDGQTVVIGGLNTDVEVPDSRHPRKVKKSLMIFVTTTIINPDGTRYHSDEEQKTLWTKPPPPVEAQTNMTANVNSNSAYRDPWGKPYIFAAVDATNQVQVATLVQDGKFLFEAEKLDEAEVKLKQALALDPANGPALNCMRLIAFKRSDEANMAEELRLIAEKRGANASPTDQDRVATLVQDGKFLYEAGNYADAEAKFKQALALDPANLPATQYLRLVTIRRNEQATRAKNFLRLMAERRDTNAVAQNQGAAANAMNQVDSSWDVTQRNLSNSINRANLVNTAEGRQAIISKLDHIHFDRVNYPDITLKVVLNDLARSALYRDPDGKGINFFYDQEVPATPPANSQADTNGNPVSNNSPERFDLSQVRVNMLVDNVRLADVLDEIVRTADHPIKYEIRDYAVVFSMRGNEPLPLEIRTFHVDPNTFLKGLESAIGLPVLDRAAGGSAAIQSAVRDYFTAAGVDLSTNNGKVVIFNDRKGTLTIRATPQDLDLIEAAIQTLNTPAPQINVRAKFIEITQNPSEGFYWYLGNFRLGQGGTTNASGQTNSPGALANFAPPTNASGGPATFTGILTDPQYQGLATVLQRQDMKLLAQPQITVESGRQAQIQIGDARTLVNFGTNGYLPTNMFFGTTLDVRADVAADGFTVHLDLTPTVTEFLGYDPPLKESKGYVTGPIGPDGRVHAVPLIGTRTMSTSVTIWDGQTVMLGGLMSDGVVTVKDSVPVLGDIPLMGRLFRSTTSQKVKKSLMIFVTPTIVNPDGTRYHADAEMPWAKTGPPPQGATNR